MTASPRPLRRSFVYMLTGALGGGAARRTRCAALSRRATQPDALDRGAEHRAAAPQDRHREHAGGHHRAVPVRVPRSRRTGGDRAGSPVSRQGGVVDVFGTWCPTCHDAAPDLVRLYRKYHARDSRSSGWPTRSPATPRWTRGRSGAIARSFDIPFTLLLAGINDTEARPPRSPSCRASLRSHHDVPRTGRGRVRLVHAANGDAARAASRWRGGRRAFGEMGAELLEERSGGAGGFGNPKPLLHHYPAVYAHSSASTLSPSHSPGARGWGHPAQRSRYQPTWSAWEVV